MLGRGWLRQRKYREGWRRGEGLGGWGGGEVVRQIPAGQSADGWDSGGVGWCVRLGVRASSGSVSMSKMPRRPFARSVVSRPPSPIGCWGKWRFRRIKKTRNSGEIDQNLGS